MERNLLQIINDCEDDPVAALLALARTNDIDWTESKALDWQL